MGDFEGKIEDDIEFKQGELGYVKLIDDEGDAEIIFKDREDSLWIAKSNFGKLQVSFVQLKKSRFVTVTKDFELQLVDEEEECPDMKTGQRGFVRDIDEEGDAAIDFKGRKGVV